MQPIPDTLAPCGGCAAHPIFRHGWPGRPADTKAIFGMLSVAVLATACAVAVSVGSAESSTAALSASPGSAQPAISDGAFVEGGCRA